MTDINLLPWREDARKRNTHHFCLHMLGGSLLACGVVFLMDVYATQHMHQLERKNQALKSNIIRLKHAQDTAYAFKRRDIVLRHSQMIHSHIAHFLMSFESLIPPGIHLKRVVEQEEEVLLWGHAESADAILQLIQNIEEESGMKASVTNEAIAHDPVSPERFKQAFNIRVLFREAKVGFVDNSTFKVPRPATSRS